MKRLGDTPTIHETATVLGCTLGRYTEVGADVTMQEVKFGDYSYIVKGGSVVWSTIGKFCSWDWSHEELRAALPDIRDLSIDVFIEKYAI